MRNALDILEFIENAFTFLTSQIIQIRHILLSFVVPVDVELEEKDRVKEYRSDRQDELD